MARHMTVASFLVMSLVIGLNVIEMNAKCCGSGFDVYHECSKTIPTATRYRATGYYGLRSPSKVFKLQKDKQSNKEEGTCISTICKNGMPRVGLCCGHGECNIFCCNCGEGRCRSTDEDTNMKAEQRFTDTYGFIWYDLHSIN